MKIEFTTELFRETGLSPTDMLILIIHENDNLLTSEEISKELGLCERTVFRTKNLLLRRGFLKKGVSGKRSRYEMTDKLLEYYNK